MPLYFFHVRDGRDFPDTKGSERPDLRAARTEAIHASGEMLRGHHGSPEFWSGDEWAMNVADEAGESVLTVRFSETMHG